MPHAIVEISPEIAPETQRADLLRLLHDALSGCGVFQPADLKTRLHISDQSLVGVLENGVSARSFVHVWIYLLEGRTPAQKSALTDAAFAVLNQHAVFASQRSVDIRDMARETYRKS